MIDIDFKFWLPIITSAFAVWYSYNRTKKIEDVKTLHQKQLHTYKEQFNKEYGIYVEIWDMVVWLKQLHSTLFIVDNKPTFEKQATMLATSIGDFRIKVEAHRPFYDPSVYYEITPLIELMDKEMKILQDERLRIIAYEKYWEISANSRTEVAEIYEKICNSIGKTIHYDLAT